MAEDISSRLRAAEALLRGPMPEDLAALSRAIGLLRRLGKDQGVSELERARAAALADALAARTLADVRRRYRSILMISVAE